ncbi:MAG: hypothetical protein IJL14_09100, partial [Selenomonadaceae bacterium]|nr:hypothetical protein [Selenomonadaceae bacterium]
LSPTEIKSAGFDGTSYKTATFSDGYTADGNKITYIESSGGDILFTLTNAKITDTIKVDTVNKVVTLTADNLNQKSVTVDGGYKLALSDDLSPTEIKSAGFDGTSYKTATFSDGYTVDGDKINYIKSSGGDILFTLTNATITDAIQVDTSNKIITLTVNNLGTNDITISGNNGYKLALADTVTQTQTVANAASLINGKYTSATYAEWYELGTTITYHAATEPKIFILDGLSDDAKLNENVFVTDGDTTTFNLKRRL